MDLCFIYHLFNSPLVRAQIRASSSGTKVRHTSPSRIYAVEAPIPDLRTQHRIASILSAYDELIQINRRRIALLMEMARSLFDEWFVELRFPGHEGAAITQTQDGRLPEGWKRIRLGEGCDNFDRLRKPLSKMERVKMPGQYPYYGAAKIFDYINDYLFEGVHLLVAEDGSVRTDDGFPVLQFVNGRFWVNNHAHVLVGRGEVSTEFLFLALQRYPINGHITGSAQPKLTQANLNRIPILVATSDLMRRLNSIVSPLLDLVLNFEAANRSLLASRSLLLPRLISGELSVSTAERELETAA